MGGAESRVSGLRGSAGHCIRSTCSPAVAGGGGRTGVW